MKPYYDVVIVIGVGPNSSPAFIIDSMDSYVFHTKSTYLFILADDSHQGLGKKVQNKHPDAIVLLTDIPMGGWAGLYVNLARSFAYALDHYEFEILLKPDTDALIIGLTPEAEAIKLFDSDKIVGIAGQYPNDYYRKPWDLSWPRDRVYNGTQTWKFVGRPLSNLELTPLARKARANGYRNRENVFGGAYFMGIRYLQAIYNAGHLPNNRLRKLNMGEDHIFGLLTKAIGFTYGSLSGPEQSFGRAWKGLPDRRNN